MAEFTSSADIEAAKAMRESHVSVNDQLQEQAQSDRNLGMLQAGYDKEINKVSDRGLSERPRA